jgi:phosphatidylinositol glycan class B
MTNLFKKTSLWKIVLAVEILIACIFSIGYHQWDEYFQITEFTSYKLGITEANHLAWEYKAQIRPWIHPGINVCIVYLASKLHITDRFNHAFLFRLFAGILAFAALSFFISSLRFYLAEKRNFLWPLFALTAFVPYLMVRPSSEMMSASFILLGVASFLRLGILPNARKIIQPYLSSSLFITGIFLGLAFDFRYQTGVIALALFLWILFFVPSLKHKILDNLFLSFGLFASIGLGLLIDAWGYGQWTLTPWNYLESNLIKGVAASMGTKPFYSFLFLSAQGPLAPFILFVILINLLFWIRYPKHLFTWLTVSFFLLHSAIAHKEGRFLYPVVYLSIANGFFFLTLNEPSYFLNSFFESVKERLLIFYGSRWFLPSFIFNLLGLIFLLF